MNDYIEPKPRMPRRPRLLRGSEIVRTGDFVEGKDGEGGLVPWEGPAGFRADAFIKPIYRESARGAARPSAAVGPAPTARRCVPSPSGPAYRPCLSVSGRS